MLQCWFVWIYWMIYLQYMRYAAVVCEMDYTQDERRFFVETWVHLNDPSMLCAENNAVSVTYTRSHLLFSEMQQRKIEKYMEFIDNTIIIDLIVKSNNPFSRRSQYDGFIFNWISNVLCAIFLINYKSNKYLWYFFHLLFTRTRKNWGNIVENWFPHISSLSMEVVYCVWVMTEQWARENFSIKHRKRQLMPMIIICVDIGEYR